MFDSPLFQGSFLPLPRLRGMQSPVCVQRVHALESSPFSVIYRRMLQYM